MFDASGLLRYGEHVNQVEHALQCALLAQQAGANDELIVAALLHDVGHLKDGGDSALADEGIDNRHEIAGADWLAARLPASVSEPVRLHVEAKRYLCAVDPAYQAGLSAASILSLVLQGGPMDIEEQARFCAQPHAADAVTLRRWDDAAKDPHCAVPPLDSWRPLLASLLRVSVQP
jgi:gamma-butyrobetaine dioxygenase